MRAVRLPSLPAHRAESGFIWQKKCAENGYDLLIAADSTELEEAAGKLRSFGVDVQTVETDLATTEGVDELYEATNSRPVDILMANAGHGLGHAFLEQHFEESASCYRYEHNRHNLSGSQDRTRYAYSRQRKNSVYRFDRWIYAGHISGRL